MEFLTVKFSFNCTLTDILPFPYVFAISKKKKKPQVQICNKSSKLYLYIPCVNVLAFGVSTLSKTWLLNILQGGLTFTHLLPIS